MCVTAHKPPPSLRGERLRAEGSSSLRKPHWSGGKEGAWGWGIAGGGTYDLSIRRESERAGGRGPCCVEQHVDVESRDVRKESGKRLCDFGHKQPSQGGEEEVGQASARWGCFFFSSALKIQFNNNESTHFDSAEPTSFFLSERKHVV